MDPRNRIQAAVARQTDYTTDPDGEPVEPVTISSEGTNIEEVRESGIVASAEVFDEDRIEVYAKVRPAGVWVERA